MIAEQRHQLRDELLAMTERLVAEYAGRVPAGSVMRTVARCHHSYLARGGAADDVVIAVERAARRRLAAILPAHWVA